MATYDLTQGIPTTIKAGDILNCPYSGTYKNILLRKGKYKLECWGAEGGKGYNKGGIGGRGGYSYGIINTLSIHWVYLYVGKKGEDGKIDATATGGWNGGGYSFVNSTLNHTSGAGGGASDIRIGTTSLYARVIVAGGGGGGGCFDTGNDGDAYGGYGGGIQGQNGGKNSTPGKGGQQTEGASFGTGNDGISKDNTTTGAGGGGGWYGGFGSNNGNSSHNGGGGGGSGYVYTSSTASNYPSGCLLNSEYYLTNAETIAGNESFLSPLGEYETGHSGNGYIRITVLEAAVYYDLKDGIPSSSEIKTDDEIFCGYSGTYKKITLPKGKYKFSVVGAGGGYRTSSDYAGKGGWAIGEINLSSQTDLYLYAGGSGNTGGPSGGWNGGGRRSSYPGGGGASDIRINSTSLYARVIVAGGGGSEGGESKKGGNGGGTSGQSASSGYGTGGYGGGPTGVTNSSWQTTSQSTSTTTQSGAYAGFGFGGNGISYASGHGGAGGGGWYGGAGCYPDSSQDDDKGGGGGSGYVYTSSTASNYPSGCLLNPKYYLTNTSLVNEVNYSDGYMTIFVLKANENGVYVKMNGNWTKATGVLSKVNNIWQEAL